MKKLILIFALTLASALFSQPTVYDVHNSFISVQEGELFTIKEDRALKPFIRPWIYQRWMSPSFELIKEEFVPTVGFGLCGTQYWTFKAKADPHGFLSWKSGIFFCRDISSDSHTKFQFHGIRICVQAKKH